MSANISQEERKEAEQFLKRHEKLKSDRTNFESVWQECMDYITPRKGDVLSTNVPGEKRGHDLFDSTAILSNQLLAAALHGMLTNPAVRFFELILNDPNNSGSEEVKEWLQDVAEKMFMVLNNSNFQTEIHEIYIDLGSIGTACLFIGDHAKSLVHFAARPIKEIFVDEDNLGRIDTVNREFKWKLRQIVQEFGESNLNEWIVKKYKEGCEDEFTIVHSTCPMDEYDGDKGYKQKWPTKSVYTLKDEPMILNRSGFYEFPYAVPRWTKTSGEKYGRGPGMDTLPDTKMVNKMMETTLKGAQITVAPPFMVTDDGVIGRVRLTPHGLTVVRQMNEAPIRPLMTDARIDFGYQAVEDVRKRIRSGFYVDQLQLNEGPQMTAAEVMQRTEEKLRLMGPVLGRQHFEFLRPVIERVYKMMERKGMISPPPKVIAEKGFDVRYSSLVARAQRMSEGQNLTRAISVAAPIINAKPETLDNLNGDEALKHVFDVYGVPQKLMNKAKDVKEIRDARAKANAQIAQQQQELHQAELAQKVAPGAAQLQQAQRSE